MAFGDLLRDIANELKVSPEYLDDSKYPYSMDESVRLLFKMVDTLPLKIEEFEVLVDEKYEDWKANWAESSKENYKYNKMNKKPSFYNDELKVENPSLWFNDD